MVRTLNLQALTTNLSVLRWALAAALASVLLFVLGSDQAGIAPALSLSSRWLMVAAHVLAAFGNSVLLWGAVSAFYETERTPRWVIAAVVLVVAYHLGAALGYVLSFRHGFFYAALLLWGLKTVLCCALAIEFLILGDGLLSAIGLLLLLACVASCPFALSGGWGVAQWVVAKVAALLLSALLYWNNADELSTDY